MNITVVFTGFGVFLWSFGLLMVPEATAKSSGDVARLFDDLFPMYNNYVRPAANQSVPTQVDVVFTLKQIDTLDIKKQVMKSLGYFSINWTDEFLMWNPEDYGGVEYITVKETIIWKPDFVVNNDLEAKRQLGSSDSLVAIYSDGHVLWEPSFIGETTCLVDITFFPFDTQTCEIRLTSWMTSNYSQKTSSTTGVELFSYIENGEFEIVETRFEHTEYPMTYNEETLEGICFILMLKRRTTFYWLSLVSPLIAFPFLSPLSFLVPADSGEKTTLAITALLSVFVFLGFMFDIMPKLSNAVSYFVLLASAQVFISLVTVVCNVVILCTHNLSQKLPIPTWIQGLVGRDSVQKQTTVPCDDNETYLNNTQAVLTCMPVTWTKVARFLDKVCFFVSLVSVTLVNIIFLILYQWVW